MTQKELDDAFSLAIRLNWMKEDKNNKGNYKIPDDKKTFLKREFAKDE